MPRHRFGLVGLDMKRAGGERTDEAVASFIYYAGQKTVSIPHLSTANIFLIFVFMALLYKSKSKQKMGIYISIIIFSVIIVLPSFSNAGASFVITEIMYNSEGADSGGKVSEGTYYSHEWVEIYNASSQSIDLTDWRFNDGSSHKLIAPPEKGGQGSIVIQTGKYVILTDDAVTFLTNHPGFSGTVIDTVMNLNNTSDTLSLIDSDGNTVDSVTYQNTWGADENGYTLEKTDILGSNDSSNWHESSVLSGTPGQENSYSNQDQKNQPSNSEPPPQSQESNNPPKAKAEADKTDVVVGEKITFDASNSSDVDEDELTFNWNFGDGNKTQKEVVAHSYDKEGTYNVVLLISDGELESYDFLTITVTEPKYSDQVFINEFIPNPTGSDTDNEWIELKNEGGNEVDLSGWQLDDEEGGSNPFTIPEETVISANSFLMFSRPQTKIALNNDGDKVRLVWPNGFVLQEISYEEKVKESWSAARFGSNWQWTSSPTPGSRNVLSQAENSAPQTKSSNAVVGDDSDSGKSILKSTVNPYQNGTIDEESEQEELIIEEEIDNIPSSVETQSASAQKSFSFSGIKYFTIGLALLISFAGAITIFIIKRKLK